MALGLGLAEANLQYLRGALEGGLAQLGEGRRAQVGGVAAEEAEHERDVRRGDLPLHGALLVGGGGLVLGARRPEQRAQHVGEQR